MARVTLGAGRAGGGARGAGRRRGGAGDRWAGWAALFALALAVRLLFWRATADAAWPGAAGYQGDAWMWLDYARALAAGRPFELGVPIRPPGMAWLLAAVWDGSRPGLAVAGFCQALLGALAVVLFALAARRACGTRVGILTGLVCAGSSGLLMLSTSLNNETPYLVVVGCILLLTEAARRADRLLPVAAWGGLNALACLIRVEHALFFFLALAWLAWGWRAGSGRRRVARAAAVAGLAFAAVLAPWQLTIWGRLHDFNTGPPATGAASERAFAAQEAALASLDWEPGALAARDALPAFLRRPAANFVAATVAHRQRRVVRAEDFGLLAEAFGYCPRPLAARPFVVSTGGLNFALANHSRSHGGFDPAPLAAPPPLAGGRGAWPAALVAGLPPRDLAFTYPGHLRLVNEGYAVGWRWIRSHPGAALRLAGRKLAIFWRGATLGWTGWNAPLAGGGLRRAVDLATPEGRWPAAWRALMLAVVAWGLVLAWQRAPARVWLLFLASKLAVTVLFYGYARQGATTIPVVALALALAGERLLARWRPGGRRLTLAALAAGGLLLAAEAARYAAAPELVVDGRPVRARDVPPPGDHEEHTIAWR
ncbi:MAG: glycosyltransferase family 39 protein [Acidobacteriota bacterium]|nr:glycosyltransferase family 39 protein [Acidobacteriota bacterium]MDH3522501.1 glycosyltransferase family 39 protein [Acidobacteriota bacterium]